MKMYFILYFCSMNVSLHVFLTLKFQGLICPLFSVFHEKCFAEMVTVSLCRSFSSVMNVCLVLPRLFVLSPVYNTLLVCQQAVRPHCPEAHRRKTAPRFKQDGKEFKKERLLFKAEKPLSQSAHAHTNMTLISTRTFAKPPYWKRPRINTHLSM